MDGTEWSDQMDVVSSGNYEDVRAWGGLADAIEELARAEGFEIPVSAAAASDRRVSYTGPCERGFCYVTIASESRMFFLEIAQPGFTWASGSTDELDLLVDAIGQWCGGLPLDEFSRRFAFIAVTPGAYDREAGHAASQGWNALLGDENSSDEAEMILAVFRDGRFLDMFPGLSHGVLTLSHDADRPYHRQVRLMRSKRVGYLVVETGTSAVTEADTMDAALEAMARFRDF